MTAIYIEIYEVVQTIPRGRVLTYGLISDMIGGRMSAQGVGWALKALWRGKQTPENVPYDMSTVPWQRVVNSHGGTSTHKIPEIPPGMQQAMLEAEGIKFSDDGTMELQKYIWMEGLK